MKKELPEEKKKYSPIQYFFWMCSGSEIDILKECPTDHKRQASIGLTVFMTTLMAFCSGTYAGYYFVENIFAAFFFGVIWAALVFSIDRSMIVTIKKDPTKSKQKFVVPLLSRMVLAALIAFVISIPLELLIFKENINLHMQQYKLDRVYDIKKALERNEDVGGREVLLAQNEEALNKIEEELIKSEPTADPEYDELKRTHSEIKTKHDELYQKVRIANENLNQALRRKQIAEDAEKKANNEVPVSSSGKRELNSLEGVYYARKAQEHSAASKLYEARKTERDKLQAEYGQLVYELSQYDKKINAYLEQWQAELNDKKINIARNIENQQEAIGMARTKIFDTTDDFEESMSSAKGFVLRFMILEDLAQRNRVVHKSDTIRMESGTYKVQNSERIEYNAEGAAIAFLLWLIRILFFTIEILPTIAKIATPVGAYDKAIYYKEKDLELDFKARADDYLIQQKNLRELEYQAEQEQIKNRTKIENELYHELLTEIACAQNEIARRKINEFRKTYINKYDEEKEIHLNGNKVIKENELSNRITLTGGDEAEELHDIYVKKGIG